jgi:hypothetical protein
MTEDSDEIRTRLIDTRYVQIRPVHWIISGITIAGLAIGSAVVWGSRDNDRYKTEVNSVRADYVEITAPANPPLCYDKTKTILYEGARRVTLIDKKAELVKNNNNAKSSIDKIIMGGELIKVFFAGREIGEYYNKKNEKRVFERDDGDTTTYVGRMQREQVKKLFNKYDSLNDIVKQNIADSLSLKYNKAL